MLKGKKGKPLEEFIMIMTWMFVLAVLTHFQGKQQM